jgi:hypothetical protein
MNTKKLQVFTLSALILAVALAQPAQAAWEKVAESEHGDLFVDKSTVKRNGTNIRIMTLLSPKEQPAPSSRKATPVSFVRQVEVICSSMEAKVISGVSYTGIMGTGAVFSREEVGRFRKVVSGTPMGHFADAACGAAPKGK